jgi:hypothetical protein
MAQDKHDLRFSQREKSVRFGLSASNPIEMAREISFSAHADSPAKTC